MSNDFPLDASKYQFLHLIGCGSTSEVRTAKCLTNGRELAIKLINLEAYPMEIDLLRQEVAFWSSSQHPTVVKYYNSFTSGTTLYILMECMSGGSVADILRYAFPNGFKDECIIATILHAILRALDYIHSNKELHRDVKPANALAGSDGQIKIGDFGVAASLLINSSRYTVIGTPCYMAPEVLQVRNGYTEKADIWSFGITAIELAMGSAPYSSMAPLQIISKVLKAPPPIIPADSGFSPEFRELVKLCLNHDPNKRPTAHELLKHSFFNNVKGPEYICDNVLVKLPPLEQRFPMLRQETANQIMNNIQPKDKPKTEWNFDVSDDGSSKVTDKSSQQTVAQSATLTPIAQSSISVSSPTRSNISPELSNISVPSINNNDKISINDNSNVISTTTSTDSTSNNEQEEVRKKGRFTLKVKKQTPSLSDDALNKTNNGSDNQFPQIQSSPLFDSPQKLLPVDDEEARLQEMVNQLNTKVNQLIEEGNEIKKDIQKLLGAVQQYTKLQKKH